MITAFAPLPLRCYCIGGPGWLTAPVYAMSSACGLAVPLRATPILTHTLLYRLLLWDGVVVEPVPVW